MSTETPSRELPDGWHVEWTHDDAGQAGWAVLDPDGQPAEWGFTSHVAACRRAWELHLDGQGASER